MIACVTSYANTTSLDTSAPRKITIHDKLYIVYTPTEDSIILECMVERESMANELKARDVQEKLLLRQLHDHELNSQYFRTKSIYQDSIITLHEEDNALLKKQLKKSEARRKTNKVMMYLILGVFTLGIGLILLIKK